HLLESVWFHGFSRTAFCADVVPPFWRVKVQDAGRESFLLSLDEVPVACKSCPCGYIFISRKLLNAKHPEKSPPSTENKHEAKRRRTERVRREKINSTVNKDLENRKRSRSNSHSDHIRRGRGRPKSASAKKHEEEREKQEKEIDIYANLSDEKAFVFSVALAEINRKIINQRLIL
uniref:Chromosome 3 C16orf87 homolog n=1 Tax=Equus caballus TaxID=9796 RepID=A0A9L0SLQ7_HORSE